MTGGFGALAQVLPILESLDPTEFRIVCSIAHGAAHAIKRLGFEFVPYPDVGSPDPRRVTPKGREWRDLDQYWGRFGFGDPAYLEAVVESRLKIVSELRPDLLVTHFCPPTEIIARITGIPLICVTQSCWHPRGKAISWWLQDAPCDYERVTPAINAVLAKHGQAGILRPEDLNQGRLTFIPSFPEFDPIDDPAVQYTGPMVWSSSGRLVSTDCTRAAYVAGSLPLLLVYTGHLLDSGGRSGVLILDAVVEAFESVEADVIVAMGLGQSYGPSRPVPSHIHIRDWVDVPQLLPHTSVFIHHGGHGSCMAALLAEVRSVVIPTFQEREFNARQLQSLGLGTFLAADGLRPSELRDTVSSCQRDSGMAANLRHWRQEILSRGYGGGRQAAALIRHEMLLS
jgi:UDP:flavonoid glycosyltransferase YjiC (YdhE family)